MRKKHRTAQTVVKPCARAHTQTQEEDDEKKEAQIQVFVDKAKVWLPFETIFFKACVSRTSRVDLKIDDFSTLSLLWRLKLIGRWRDNVC